MKETIGNRIAKYRKMKGMTQEELAGKLGISSQAVSKWETDASCPDISLLPELCRLLGISTDTLLTGEEETVRMMPPGERRPMEELTLRVRIHSADGDKIRVNLPMPLVMATVEMGLDASMTMGKSETLKNLDLGKILELVERGVLGKLVEMESAQGETLEVVVE